MDTKGKVACCITCLLAEAMKDCKTCPFNIGLAERLQGLAQYQLTNMHEITRYKPNTEKRNHE